MSEYEQPPITGLEPWVVTGRRLEKVTTELGEPFTIRQVLIEFMEPDWITGDGIFKAECTECHAYSTMRASERQQLRYLVSVVEQYECPKRGHAPELKPVCKSPLDEAISMVVTSGWANEANGHPNAPTGWFARLSNSAEELAELNAAFEGELPVPITELEGHFLYQLDIESNATVRKFETERELVAEYRFLEIQADAWRQYE